MTQNANDTADATDPTVDPVAVIGNLAVDRERRRREMEALERTNGGAKHHVREARRAFADADFALDQATAAFINREAQR